VRHTYLAGFHIDFQIYAFLRRYLQTQHDIDVLVRGVRVALRIAKAGPLSSFLDHADTNPELDHNLDKESDEALETVVRSRVETM